MQWHPENLLNFLLGVIILSSNNYDFLVLECNLWYCMVAFFAALSTVGGKSYLCAGPSLCNSVLTVIILPSVSLRSRLGLNAVLFFLMSENTLSSSALECGMVRTKRAIDESLGNWLCPSALFMARMEFQMTSAYISHHLFGILPPLSRMLECRHLRAWQSHWILVKAPPFPRQSSTATAVGI